MQENGGAGHQYVDLHIHTRHSDGSCTVEQILDMASKRGLTAIAITDHDNLDGCAPAIEVGAALGIEVIPATELSAEIEGCDVHILAYYVEAEHSANLLRRMMFAGRTLSATMRSRSS